MALTRLQIINEGLSQAGRTDLTSNGRLWLNLFLEKIYKTQDFEWLSKLSTGLTLTHGGAVPSDYRNMRDSVLKYNGEAIGWVTSITVEEYMSLLRGGAAEGPPRKVFINKQAGTFNFWPEPSLSYTWDLAYYYIPTLPTHTDSSGDAANPTWGLQDEILIRAVELKALYYKDDERYDKEEQILMREIMEGKLNSIDRRGGSSKLKLGKSFRRRF